MMRHADEAAMHEFNEEKAKTEQAKEEKDRKIGR